MPSSHPEHPAAFHLADDDLFLEHRSRGHHPERPERLEAARRGVERAVKGGLRALPLAPRDATRGELEGAHSTEYLTALFALEGHRAALDADTYLAPRSIAAARRAAGGAIALVEKILAAKASEGEPTRGMALLRPPGHHATRGQGMGFCLVNNVAIAAHAALAAGLSRVAIVDFDVHHGNGTQDIFWEDDRVLFVSLHEMPLYPGTGAAFEIGVGKGAGYTVNVPLPASATDAVYRAAFEEVVLPALARFAPELILVSAGYDAHARDPLASMRLSPAGYRFMCASMARAAEATAGGRIALVLEGGYDLTAIEESVAASLEGLCSGQAEAPAGEVGEEHREAIALARRALEAGR